ncbi:MAG: iodothyronine deiodinase [Terrestrivirus sp.]|uniref:Iodothyronine deiodinase n=1 Tax=Terrestrivirus sp. TaxID=2487775 RepID=A0A3G4ZQR0_9VIRU|nr:MAG: iodothyronine deiodinase [Terrestrivirus sp.]
MFIIYINEAHAADVWNIGESAGVINYSHKEIKQRIQYAIKFRNTFELEIPIYCDNMNNDAESKYASWPFRYYVISNNKTIKFIGQPEESYFDITELFNFLNKK